MNEEKKIMSSRSTTTTSEEGGETTGTIGTNVVEESSSTVPPAVAENEESSEGEYEEFEVEVEEEIEVEVDESSSSEEEEEKMGEVAGSPAEESSGKTSASATNRENVVKNDDGKEKEVNTQKKVTWTSSSEEEDDEDIGKDEQTTVRTSVIRDIRVDEEAEVDVDDGVELRYGQEEYRGNGVIRAKTGPAPSSLLHSCNVGKMLVFRKECFVDSAYNDQRVQLEEEEYNVDVGSIVRWKHDENDGSVKSNARIVQWSDGTFMLQVGEKYFKLLRHQTVRSDADFMYKLQACSEDAHGDDAEKSVDILENKGKISSKIRFIAMDKKSSRSMSGRVKKSAGAKLLVTDRDLESERNARMRAERAEEKQKISIMRQMRNAHRSSGRVQRVDVSQEDEDVAPDAFDAGETNVMSVRDTKKRNRTADIEEEYDGGNQEYDEEHVKRPRVTYEATKSIEMGGDSSRMEVENDARPSQETAREASKTNDDDAGGVFEIDDDDDDDESATVTTTTRTVARTSRRVVDDDDDDDN